MARTDRRVDAVLDRVGANQATRPAVVSRGARGPGRVPRTHLDHAGAAGAIAHSLRRRQRARRHGEASHGDARNDEYWRIFHELLIQHWYSWNCIERMSSTTTEFPSSAQTIAR